MNNRTIRLPIYYSAQTNSVPLPRRIARTVGECARSAIIVIIWGTALAVALTAGYLVLRALLFFVSLAQQALGL